MDKRPDPRQQLRERDNKVYTQKAEVKAKEMKELTGSPQIDPLSRKMAEIMTQRELASLGIQPEPPSKKPVYTVPKPKPVENPIRKKEKTPTPVLIPEFKFEEPEPTPVPEFQDLKAKTPESKEENQKNPENFENTEKVPVISVEKLEDLNENKDDMLNNIEHIQAFQEELQREYPELALNEDAEGSSFHTNELNELEEACKELSLEQEAKNFEDFAGVNEFENNGELQKKLSEVASNQTEYEEKNPQIQKKNSLKASKPSQFSDKAGETHPDIQVTKRNSDHITQALSSKAFTDIKSSRTPEILKRASMRLQESASKAALLFSQKQTVSKYAPRCHINLTNCKSSPIFYSFLVPPDAKMKSEQGFASAASLRHLLLRNLPDPEPVPQDMYAKNQAWLLRKLQKLEKIREDEKDKSIDGCTFDPYYEKHRSEKKNTEKFYYKASIRPDLLKANEEESPIKFNKDVKLYEALSPAEQELKYKLGFNLDKMLEVGKMMINYRSINLLK